MEQAPIDKEIFSLYPVVVSDPDNVYLSEPHRESVDGVNFKEFPRIVSEKNINGTICVVEEVRRNENKDRRRLAFITMWKKDGGESGVQQTSVTPQAESLSLGATDSPLQNTIPSAKGIVNPERRP